MRAKYKLGNLVSVGKEGEPQQFGAIEGVLLTRDGVKYQVTSIEQNVNESDIVDSYRKIQPRAPKSKAKKPRAAKE